ncbi:hypothetical protein PV797_14115 [Clostridiaceae bacterium M8S5]|nr:hypothetical protein PV797_14115 [Clostridiaceae bacterium M8S5]
MVNHVFKDLEILDIFYENDFQKIFICRDKNDDQKVYVNSIGDKQIVDNINEQELENAVESIKSIKEFNGRLFIVSDYNENNLHAFIEGNHLSLGEQFTITEKIMDNINTYNRLPNFLSKAMINKYNVVLEENNNIKNLGLFIFDGEVDNAPNSFSVPLAEMISYIFTGSDNKETRDEGLIPPDVREIINKCKQYDYLDIQQCKDDLKNSGVYGLVSVSRDNKNDDSDDTNTEEANFRRNIGDVYNYRRIRKPRKSVIAGIAAVVIIGAFIAFGGLKLFTSNDTKDPQKPVVAKSDNENNDTEGKDDVIGKNTTPDVIDKQTDDVEVIGNYYNDDFTNKFKDETLAKLSDDKIHKGQSSLKIENGEDAEKKYLVAGIDLNDKFKEFKGKKTEFSYWIYTDKGQEITISLDYLKGGKKITTKTKKVYIPSDTWVLNSCNIDANKGDFVKMYVTTKVKSNLWIDTFKLEPLK